MYLFVNPKYIIYICVHTYMFIYRMSEEQRSIFWEVIISVILSKNIYMNLQIDITAKEL